MVLKGSVSYSQKGEATVFTSRRFQSVGVAVVWLTYSCDKYFGKCFEEGWVGTYVKKEEGIDVDLTPVNVRCYGKLDASEEGSLVKVKIASGRGDGALEITYIVSVSSLSEGVYGFSIIFTYNKSGGEKLRIGDPIEVKVRVRKPLRIEQFTLTPSADYYVLGDPVEIFLKISSEYNGVVLVGLKGALKEQSTKYSVSEGSQKLELKSTMTHLSDKVKVAVSIPELDYVESVEKDVVVKQQRIEIENIEVEKPEIGKKTSMTISLANVSTVSDSPIHIKANIYGYLLERSEVLKPMERKSLVIETPILTKDARKNLEGSVLLVDRVTGREIAKSINLPSPIPLPVKIGFVFEEPVVRVPSSRSRKVLLYISNESDVSTTIDLLKSSSKFCGISMNRITVPPLGYVSTDLELKPKSVGKEEVGLDFIVVVNDTAVDVYSTKVSIEVYEAFNIESIKILNPSKTDRAVKSQEVEIELVFNVHSEWVDVSIISPEMSIKDLVYRIYSPKTSIRFSSRVMDYVDHIRISVSDGTVRHEVKVPIKVEKPSVDYKITPTTIHAGVRKSVVLSLKNRFEVPLSVDIELGGGKSVEFKSSKLSLELEPLGEERVDIEIVKARFGLHDIGLKIVSKLIDERDKKIVDVWSVEDVVKIEVASPVAISTSKLPDYLMLPHPADGLESTTVSFNFDIYVENLTDEVVPEVFFRSKTDPSVVISINPSSVSMKPKSKEKVSATVLITASYPHREVGVVLIPSVGGLELPELMVKTAVSRYAFSVVEISKLKFIEDRCVYPRLVRGDRVYVLIPITVEEVGICGEPSKVSVERFKVMKAMYKVLSETLPLRRDPWAIAASVMFKKVTQVDADFSDELKFLSSMSDRSGSIIVVPEVLWSITLSKLLGRTAPTDYSVLRDVKEIGSLYVLGSSLYKSRSDIYRELARFTLGDDSGESLHRFILSYVELGRVDPIILLYVLNGGRRVPHNKELADKLLHEGRFDDYLMYLTISDVALVDNYEILRRLAEVVSSVKKSSSILALAILFNQIIRGCVSMLGGVSKA